MYQLKTTSIYGLILFFFCSLGQLCAQEAEEIDIDIDIDRSFFSLRNSRVTVGLLLHGNYVSEENQKPVFQHFIGALPDEEQELTFNDEQNPYISFGLYLDWFAPNSSLSLTLGGEYNFQEFSINSSGVIYDYGVKSILIPAYLKYQFGSIHSKSHAQLMFGGYYSQPLNYTRKSGGEELTFKNEQQPSFGLSTIFGLQFRLTSKDSNELFEHMNVYPEYPRAWLFLRADRPIQGIFDSANRETQVLPGFDNNEWNFQAVNFTIGIAFFLGNFTRR